MLRFTTFVRGLANALRIAEQLDSSNTRSTAVTDGLEFQMFPRYALFLNPFVCISPVPCASIPS